jgi:hypothetical protein
MKKTPTTATYRSVFRRTGIHCSTQKGFSRLYQRSDAYLQNPGGIDAY